MDAVLLFNVRNQKIERMDNFYVVEKSKNYLKAKFDFKTDDWDGVTKTAIFKCKSGAKRAVLDKDDMCDVPWEFTAEAGKHTVGVFGGELITVNKAIVVVHESSYEDSTIPPDPTPSEYEKIISLVEETKAIAQSVRDDANNGVFDGEQGEKGETGETGATGKAGADGQNGKDGQDGADGKDGLSAYDIAVKNGFEGTEQEWIESLKGADGKDGADGQDGKDGADGETLSEEHIKRIEELEIQVADLLYTAIAITSFTNNVKTAELGSVVNNVTLTWVLNKNAENLTIDGIDYTDNPSTSLSLTGLNLSANKTWSLKVTDERGETASANTSLSFLNGAYYGVNSEPSSYDSNFILGLASKTLTSTRARTINVNAGVGEYIFYCIPARLGACSFNVGGFDGGFDLVATINHINSSGHAEDYLIYKSTNDNLGSTTVKIT